jgi:hypothetical protein
VKLLRVITSSMWIIASWPDHPISSFDYVVDVKSGKSWRKSEKSGKTLKLLKLKSRTLHIPAFICYISHDLSSIMIQASSSPALWFFVVDGTSVYNGQQRDSTVIETVMACQYWYQKKVLVLQKLYKASASTVVHSPSDSQSKSKSVLFNFK